MVGDRLHSLLHLDAREIASRLARGLARAFRAGDRGSGKYFSRRSGNDVDHPGRSERSLGPTGSPNFVSPVRQGPFSRPPAAKYAGRSRPGEVRFRLTEISSDAVYQGLRATVTHPDFS